MWLGMMLWMLVFWVGVIILAVWLAGWLFPGVATASRSPAHDILAARYARGELTEEIYRRMRRELGSDTRRHGPGSGVLIVVLVLAALAVLSGFTGWGMLGSWGIPPGSPPHSGGPFFWMPHMWGR